MRKKKYWAVLSIVGLIGFVAIGGGGMETAQAQSLTFKWRIQAAVPSSSIYFELLMRLADRMAKISGGRLVTEVLPEHTVVPAFEILDAVQKGLVEGGFAWTHYWSGRHPAAMLFSAPVGGSGRGLDQMGHMAWVYEGGGKDLLDQFYSEILKVSVKAFLIQPIGPDPLGWFKRPIQNMNDFRKLKYCSPPGIMSEVLREMGISAVVMAGGEIIPAGQRGVIDAVKWFGPADDMLLGFHSVWKHYYLQGLHQTTDVGELLIHKGFWDKLPPDLREVIQMGAMASIADTWNFNIQRNAAALKTLMEKHKVEVHDTPEEFYGEYLRACNKVLDKNSARDPFFKKVLESQQQFADLVAPYWTKSLQLYRVLGNAGLGHQDKR